eukprot:GHVU01025630.1.p2 GENE.GHVU01025630.1~~GHVU01025630.1.p2  ORF type:complete len:112 (-),score=3.32 GHVU01025630.1:534-869(-)
MMLLHMIEILTYHASTTFSSLPREYPCVSINIAGPVLPFGAAQVSCAERIALACLAGKRFVLDHESVSPAYSANESRQWTSGTPCRNRLAFIEALHNIQYTVLDGGEEQHA